MHRLVAAPDKFRGTASAAELAEAACRAARSSGWRATAVPMADGGEGTLDVIGGARRQDRVQGPSGAPVLAEWRMLGGRRRGEGRCPDEGLPGILGEVQPTAVIEVAQASGLELAGGPEGNDPVGATTAGTGQLIGMAVAAGARQVVVACGGSATTDGGLGAVEALERGGRLAGVRLVVAHDVDATFVDAAAGFGPQKGATPAQVELLTRRLERLTQLYRQRYGVDVSHLRGGGAAGGLAGGLAALGAVLVPGFEWVADALGLAEHLVGADLVVTGEGRLDEHSFRGKVVGGVLKAAAEAGVPALLVVGDAGGASRGAVAPVDQGPGRWTGPGLCGVSLVATMGRAEACAEPLAGMERAVRAHLSEWW